MTFSKDALTTILVLMKRAPLKGEEVPMYNQAWNELAKAYEAPEEDAPKDEK